MGELAEQIFTELEVHTAIEEQIFGGVSRAV
jgi:hypothetical protein